jgi:DNA-binding transcriptional LysR family regulator
MEFRQLEYFHTISKLENFTRTAEALHVSQPSVTKAIKALEAELEMTLIDRRQKHVTLTTEGKAFLLHVEKILWAVDEAKQDMTRFQKNKHGIIHFGMPPMMEAYLFPKLFTKFKEAYSNIEIDVREYGDSTEVLAKIEAGELDMGMIIGSEPHTQNSMMIMQDQMNLCVDHHHPLHDKISVDFRQLKNEKFILQQPNTYQYKQIYARCVENGFTPDILLCTSQLKTIKQLVANKVGISLLLDLVTRQETIFKRVPVYPPMPVNISLIWSRSKCLSHAAESFVSFMQDFKKSNEFKAFLDEKIEA